MQQCAMSLAANVEVWIPVFLSYWIAATQSDVVIITEDHNSIWSSLAN